MTEPMAYIGRDSAGVVQAVRVDTRDDNTADSVAGMIRDGLTVERVSCAWARKYFLTNMPSSVRP